MTQKESILEAFRRNGNQMTLGYMLQFPWGYKAASRMSDLRKQGYIIKCEEQARPSDNIYTLYEIEDNGQMVIAGCEEPCNEC